MLVVAALLLITVVYYGRTKNAPGNL
jgi:hypothetical protein